MNKTTLRQELRSQLEAYLTSNGMRQTSVRYKILDKCVDQRVHFDIHELYEDLRREQNVSLASVYKTVELLCECNILRKHYLRENQAAYEIAGESHLHLICLNCGAVSILEIGDSDIGDEKVERLIASGKYRSFKPSFLTANVYGLCASCRNVARAHRLD